MMDRGMDLMRALNHVRERRTIAEPNPGFIIQLKAFEKLIFGVMSECPIYIKKKDNKAPQREITQDPLAKEVTDGIEQMKLSGDLEGAKDLEMQLAEGDDKVSE